MGWEWIREQGSRGEGGVCFGSFVADLLFLFLVFPERRIPERRREEEEEGVGFEGGMRGMA